MTVKYAPRFLEQNRRHDNSFAGERIYRVFSGNSRQRPGIFGDSKNGFIFGFLVHFFDINIMNFTCETITKRQIKYTEKSITSNAGVIPTTTLVGFRTNETNPTNRDRRIEACLDRSILRSQFVTLKQLALPEPKPKKRIGFEENKKR